MAENYIYMHTHTLCCTSLGAALNQSVLCITCWSIKKPLITAQYCFLLDVNFNLQSPIQFPFRWAPGKAPKSQDNDERGREVTPAEMGKCLCVGRTLLGCQHTLPSLLYLPLKLSFREEVDVKLDGRRQ